MENLNSNLQQLSYDTQALQQKLVEAHNLNNNRKLQILSQNIQLLQEKLGQLNSSLSEDTVYLQPNNQIKGQNDNRIQNKGKSGIKGKEIKSILSAGDSQTALKKLGFKISTDENGGITILNGYSSVVSKTKKGIQTLSDLKIDENELLKNVVKIKGNAVFQDRFIPDHYIETDTISTVNNSRTNADRIKRDLLKQNPEFQKALKDNDVYSLLKVSGYDVEKDENGKVTFNGDLTLGHHENKRFGYISFDYLGINNEDLLNGIDKINGNLSVLVRHAECKLNPNMEITGSIICFPNEKEKLLKDFSSTNEIVESYKDKQITPILLNSLANAGIIKSFRMQERSNYSIQANPTTYYYSTEEIKDKLSDDKIDFTLKALSVNEALDNEDDLTAFELLGYDIDSDFETDKITIKGDYKPYFTKESGESGEKQIITYESLGINQDKLLKNVVKITGSADFQDNFKPGHDIEIGSEIETIQNDTVYATEQNSTNITNSTAILKSDPNFQEAVKNNDTVTILKMCGFDVKKDRNGTVTFNGDLDFAKPGNKKFAHISFADLGVNEQDIIDGIDKIKGNLIIPQNSQVKLLSTNLEVTGLVVHSYSKEDIFSDFYELQDIVYECQEKGMDITPNKIKRLADEGYLKSIKAYVATSSVNYPSLRYFPYEGQNEDFLEELASGVYDDDEVVSSILTEKDDVKDTEIKEDYSVPFLASDKFPNVRTWVSFVSAVAWHLSPNTREVMKQMNNNPYIHEIIDKNRALIQLYKDIAVGKISLYEVESKIDKLQLNPSEIKSLKAYFKKCWNIAGTGEYKAAYCKAKEISKVYSKFGIEKINDESLKNRIIKWEQENKPAFV